MFDLTFVTAYGTATNDVEHLLVTDEIRAGVIGFAFSRLARVWQWPPPTITCW